MLKILMILSIAAMIVTGVFGWQNRQTFVEERKAKHAFNKQITQLKEKVYDDAKETSKQHEFLTTTEGERDVAAELLRSAEREYATAQTKLGGLESEVKTKEEQLAALQKKLDEFQAMVAGALGAGIKIDDIEPKYAELKKIVESGKEELTQLGKELDVAKENLANKIKDREGLEGKQASRREEFKRNTLSATVTEVNNDFGIVVFNAGKKSKIDGSTDLLVVRPGQGGICRLSVVDGTDSQTTAEIRQETLAPGTLVRVGDRVIIGTPR